MPQQTHSTDEHFERKTPIFGLPRGKKREPVVWQKVKTQMESVESLFYVLFTSLGLLREKFVVEEGEYSLKDGAVTASFLSVYSNGRVMRDDLVKWEGVQRGENYLYIILTPGGCPCCVANYTTRREQTVTNAQEHILVGCAKVDATGELVFDATCEGAVKRVKEILNGNQPIAT